MVSMQQGEAKLSIFTLVIHEIIQKKVSTKILAIEM